MPRRKRSILLVLAVGPCHPTLQKGLFGVVLGPFWVGLANVQLTFLGR
jgi:hypothetical protein